MAAQQQSSFAEGLFHQVSGRWSEAQGAYRQSADLSWQWEVPQLAHANLLRVTDSPRKALEVLDQVASLFPTSPWPYWLKGLTLMKTNAAESALASDQSLRLLRTSLKSTSHSWWVRSNVTNARQRRKHG